MAVIALKIIGIQPWTQDQIANWLFVPELFFTLAPACRSRGINSILVFGYMAIDSMDRLILWK
jgi:hypothetical protein